MHGAVFSKDHSIYVQTSRTMDAMPKSQVFKKGGKLIGELPSVAENPERRPAVDLLQVGTKERKFHAAVVFPRDYDARKKYPVIVDVYGGPHHIHVMATQTRWLLDQWYADQGFIVVAIDGRMRRSEYRKFRIRGAPQDDYAAMREVVLRRYQRSLDHGGPFPDLVVVDGGKGQLMSAYAALADIGLDRLVAVGLAKQEEIIFTRDRAEGLVLGRDAAALRLLQRIRDEAHRFAVSFHRQSRTRRDLRSALDDIAGIGPARRRRLLAAFGSVAGVRRASRAELENVVGRRAADTVLRHFAGAAGPRDIV